MRENYKYIFLSNLMEDIMSKNVVGSGKCLSNRVDIIGYRTILKILKELNSVKSLFLKISLKKNLQMVFLENIVVKYFRVDLKIKDVFSKKFLFVSYNSVRFLLDKILRRRFFIFSRGVRRNIFFIIYSLKGGNTSILLKKHSKSFGLNSRFIRYRKDISIKLFNLIIGCFYNKNYFSFEEGKFYSSTIFYGVMYNKGLFYGNMLRGIFRFYTFINKVFNIVYVGEMNYKYVYNKCLNKIFGNGRLWLLRKLSFWNSRLLHLSTKVKYRFLYFRRLGKIKLLRSKNNRNRNKWNKIRKVKSRNKEVNLRWVLNNKEVLLDLIDRECKVLYLFRDNLSSCKRLIFRYYNILMVLNYLNDVSSMENRSVKEYRSLFYSYLSYLVSYYCVRYLLYWFYRRIKMVLLGSLSTISFETRFGMEVGIWLDSFFSDYLIKLDKSINKVVKLIYNKIYLKSFIFRSKVILYLYIWLFSKIVAYYKMFGKVLLHNNKSIVVGFKVLNKIARSYFFKSFRFKRKGAFRNKFYFGLRLYESLVYFEPVVIKYKSNSKFKSNEVFYKNKERLYLSLMTVVLRFKDVSSKLLRFNNLDMKYLYMYKEYIYYSIGFFEGKITNNYMVIFSLNYYNKVHGFLPRLKKKKRNKYRKRVSFLRKLIKK